MAGIRYQEEQALFVLHPIKGVTIKCFETGTDYRGASTYRAEVRHNGKIVFDNLRGAFSPRIACDGDDAKAHVLGHAAMKPGDTDGEFFAGYTPAQLDFVETFGDELDSVRFSRYGDL